jgi:seryl-tRNA synthetase
MLDIKRIREDAELVARGLEAKNARVDINALLDLDRHKRSILMRADELRAQINAANDEISRLLKEKKIPKKRFWP